MPYILKQDVGIYHVSATTNTTPFEVRCHLDKSCTGEQWLAVVNYDSGIDTIFMSCWYIYCSEKAKSSLFTTTQNLVSVFFLCRSPIRYNLLLKFRCLHSIGSPVGATVAYLKLFDHELTEQLSKKPLILCEFAWVENYLQKKSALIKSVSHASLV